MPKLLWVVICQRAIVSSQNTVTLVDVLEDVQIPAPPPEYLEPGKPQLMIPLRFAIVGLWERADENDAGQTPARIRMTAPDGKAIGGAPFEINLALTARFRSLSEAPGMPYLGPGYYTVKLETQHNGRWRTAGTSRFRLTLLDQPSGKPS
jgi:hypothetical protein